MLLIQLTGLSGAGKTTIANGVKKLLEQKAYRVEVIDGDIYRKILCHDLGFSKEDRHENILRLGFVANLLATNGVIAILAAINPYEEIRRELRKYGPHVNTVWINCDIETLIKRDTKQLYKKAMLPDNHPGKINNLSGINDPYESPQNADLVIHTNLKPEDECIKTLVSFILKKIQQ
jgi:adenylylsulfate kinase